MSHNRREFIKKVAGMGVLTVASPLLASKLFAKEETTKITLLHTNDWHSRIEPFPMDGGRFQGLGGVAPRAALVKQVRSEEEHVLLLDAGDIFQGTPYFNFFEGELEYKVMSEMQYDLATFGNHDFDLGLTGLEKVWHHKNFDFVNCNYVLKDTFLDGKVPAYKIFSKAGIRIGITGVGIDLNGLVPAKNHAGVLYQNPIEKLNHMASRLKYDYKCDLVICLSHLGFSYHDDKVSDIRLAEASKDVDIIIGGHTHTFMKQAEIVTNAAGGQVFIHQVGWAGINLGRIDIYFSEENKKRQISGVAMPVVNMG